MSTHIVQGNPAPSIDFSALGAEAANMINSGATTESVQPINPSPVVPPAGDSAPPASVPPSLTQDNPALQTPQGEQPATFEVDLGNGQKETLTAEQIRELRANGLRQADYTRKTQELAQQRQQAEAMLQQLRNEQAQIQQVLSNPQALMYLAQQQLASQPAPLDPNAPLTVGQLQQTVQAIQQQLQQSQLQVAQQTEQLVQDRLQTANYAESINSTLGELYTQHPVLKLTPETEDILRYRVAQKLTDTSTLDDAIVAFKAEAATLAQAYDSYYTQRQQSQQAQRAALAATGTEAPGGAAPQPTKQSFGNGRSVDWKALQDAALSLARGQ